jgi:hypothetical protein
MSEKAYCSNCHCALDDINPKFSDLDFGTIKESVAQIEREVERGTVQVDSTMCLLEHLHNYLCEQLIPDYQ